MYQKIKAFFYHFSKRKIYSFPLITAIFLFFPKVIFAAGLPSWGDIVGAVTGIPSNLIILLSQLVIAVTAGLAGTASKILEWVLSPGFTDLSYTNPGGNPIIAIGLNITQSFVNMALVLILVFIAFSTILRLKEYQTQKLLISLIVVALLVNFAPVICGLIIDPCNILMHYFTDHVTGFKTVWNMSSGYADRISALFTFNDFKEQIDLIVESFTLIIFNIMLLFLILTYALIFALRYAVIWVLVILSPLAFVCYILPATKKIWNQWWNQFINWSIIGITTGFFLYLAEQVMEQAKIIVPNTPESGSGFANVPLQYMVPLIFMFLGLMFAFQTSAMGSSQILAFAKKGGQKARGWAEKGGKKVAAQIPKSIDSGIRGVVRGSKETEGGFLKKTWGGIKEGGKGSFKGALRGEEPESVTWAKRKWGEGKEKIGASRPGTAALREEAKRADPVKRLEALYRDNPEELRKVAEKEPTTEEEKIESIEATNILAKDKKLKYSDMERIEGWMDKGTKGINIKAVINAKPEYTYKITKGTKKPTSIKEQVQKYSASQLIENTQVDSFENIDFLRHLSPIQHDYISTSDKVSPETKQKVLDTVLLHIDEINREVDEALKSNDPIKMEKADELINLGKIVYGPNYIY